jgi:hypothetical protein
LPAKPVDIFLRARSHAGLCGRTEGKNEEERGASAGKKGGKLKGKIKKKGGASEGKGGGGENGEERRALKGGID